MLLSTKDENCVLYDTLSLRSTFPCRPDLVSKKRLEPSFPRKSKRRFSDSRALHPFLTFYIFRRVIHLSVNESKPRRNETMHIDRILRVSSFYREVLSW